MSVLDLFSKKGTSIKIEDVEKEYEKFHKEIKKEFQDRFARWESSNYYGDIVYPISFPKSLDDAKKLIKQVHELSIQQLSTVQKWQEENNLPHPNKDLQKKLENNFQQSLNTAIRQLEEKDSLFNEKSKGESSNNFSMYTWRVIDKLLKDDYNKLVEEVNECKPNCISKNLDVNVSLIKQRPEYTVNTLQIAYKNHQRMFGAFYEGIMRDPVNKDSYNPKKRNAICKFTAEKIELIHDTALQRSEYLLYTSLACGESWEKTFKNYEIANEKIEKSYTEAQSSLDNLNPKNSTPLEEQLTMNGYTISEVSEECNLIVKSQLNCTNDAIKIQLSNEELLSYEKLLRTEEKQKEESTINQEVVVLKGKITPPMVR